MARTTTETRRALQPLFSALDAHLAPWLPTGALLCVSGGSDSRALLEAAARWPGRFAGELVVASVDHGLRPTSADDARGVCALAAARAFPAEQLTLPPTPASEGALRAARYAALAALCRRRGLGTLVVAHQADDVAEGALLSWLGAGGGPGGAAPPRVTEREGLVVVRPFLHLPRATLRAALAAIGALDWLEDPEAVSQRARVRRALGALARGRELSGPLARAAFRRREDEGALAAAAQALVAYRDGAWQVDGRAAPALVRRALEQAVRAALPGDARRAAAGLEVALGLLAHGRQGRVDLAGGRLEVLAGVLRVLPGSAVAAEAVPTHNAQVAAPVTPLAELASMRTVDGQHLSDEPDEQRRTPDEQT